jgi:hypothetical protein
MARLIVSATLKSASTRAPCMFTQENVTCFGRHQRELAAWRGISNRIVSVREESEARLRQLLNEEQAAASRNRFQRARELKSASESERIEAERTISILQVSKGFRRFQPHEAKWHRKSSSIISCANALSSRLSLKFRVNVSGETGRRNPPQEAPISSYVQEPFSSDSREMQATTFLCTTPCCRWICCDREISKSSMLCWLFWKDQQLRGCRQMLFSGPGSAFAL